MCLGSSVQLSASGGVAYIWYPSTGLNDSTISNPIASPGTNTTYIVTVYDTNGCPGADSTIVLVYPLPTANAGNDTSMCLGSSVQLFASGGVAYIWYPSTGLNDSTISNPIASPGTTTTYIVTVYDTNGCPDADSTIVLVYPLPTANAGNDTSMCLGSSVQLSASGGVAYIWYPSTGLNDSTISNPIASPGTNTTYIVTVYDTNGCPGADSTIVLVYPLPTANAGNDTSMCLGSSVQLFASGGVAYIWYPSTGLNDSTISNPIASPGTTTTYIVTVYDTNGCPDADSTIVLVYPLPPANAGNDTSICQGNSVQLSAGGGIAYSWDPPTGLSDSSIFNPIANPNTTIAYIVTVTDTNGCQNTDTVTITISIPPANAGTDTSICVGDSIQLAASGGISYSWSPSTGLSDTSINNPIAYPSTTTTYIITVTDTIGCVVVDTITLSVDSLPIAITSADDTICFGDSVQLTVTGGITYSWQPTTGLSNPNIGNPMASPDTTTIYTVTATDSNGCSSQVSASSTVTVTVFPLPTADAGPDVTIYIGESTQLNAISNNTISYTWTPPAGLNNTNISNPIATPDSTTTYYVTVISPDGCINIDSVTVTVINITIDVPDIFTPNGDKINDLLYVAGRDVVSIEFKVYNRWGTLVFETYDMTQGWDGTYNGKPLDMDTYMYYLKAITIISGSMSQNGNEIEEGVIVKHGNITLIR